MGLWFVLPLLLASLFTQCLGENVIVTVRGVTTIANTDDVFVCVTLDWWPRNKCNYNMCPWAKASLLNLDLDHPLLINAVKEFKNLRVRIGGSLQDQILYNVRNSVPNCTRDFIKDPNGMFGFSTGCLTMERWDEVNQFMGNAGAVVTFGLNALNGRQKPTNPNVSTLWTGPWDSSNARDFIEYTNSKGYAIESWEFGNELCSSGVSARLDPSQYGQDMIVLKELVNELYKNSSIQPKILGPAGFFDQQWFAQMLQVSGPNIVDIVSHHIYNLGPGVDPHLYEKMQDPYLLDNTAQTYKDVDATVQRFGPWASSWVSESGGAYNSGGRLVSHAFVDSFWYLDQLGMSSLYNHQVFCRQVLVGGNYALLNTTTMKPHPDYYSALLFHRLMGKGVLAATHDGSPYLRAYSHCSREKPGITLLLINLSNTTSLNVSVANDPNLYPSQAALATSVGQIEMMGRREEYHLTAKDGNLKSTTMLLNGIPLEVTHEGDIPPMDPAYSNVAEPLIIAPSSIVFVTLKDFKAPACA